MHKLKCIVVENDPKSLSLLLSLITDYCPELEPVSSVSNIKDATREILARKPDVVFLDIELDDGTGFDVLNQVPDKKFSVIVTSGHSHYAFDAFKFEVAHYLLKPVSIRDLRIALDRVLQHYDSQKEIVMTGTGVNQKIQVNTSEGTKIYNLKEIEFFQADGCYTNIFFTNKNPVIVSKHLKSFESVLSANNFYRIGRKYIINLDCVKAYTAHSGGTITMENGSRVSIPRRNKHEFIKYLNSYLKDFK
ncbi:MAG: response regulator transcription factor [Bacteroidales bacterium]|nr:response regulator transcription factor [Bacteroidales bacterium]